MKPEHYRKIHVKSRDKCKHITLTGYPELFTINSVTYITLSSRRSGTAKIGS